MYARIGELILAGWLLAAAWLFAGPTDGRPANLDVAVALGIVAVTLVAWIGPWSWPRLLHLVLAAVLIASAYLGSATPAEPLYQNRMIVACLLIMFCLVPTRAWRLPSEWERVLGRPGRENEAKGESR